MAVRHFGKVAEPLPSGEGPARAILGVTYRTRDVRLPCGDVIRAWRHSGGRDRSQAPPGGGRPGPGGGGRWRGPWPRPTTTSSSCC